MPPHMENPKTRADPRSMVELTLCVCYNSLERSRERGRRHWCSWIEVRREARGDAVILLCSLQRPTRFCGTPTLHGGGTFNNTRLSQGERRSHADPSCHQHHPRRVRCLACQEAHTAELTCPAFPSSADRAVVLIHVVGRSLLPMGPRSEGKVVSCMINCQ